MHGAAFKRFLADRHGATATMFGLSLFLLMGCVGVAFDSARVYSVSDKVRNALDAAALAGAKLLDEEGTTDTEIQQRAAAFFETYRAKIEGTSVELTNFLVTINRADNTVNVSVDINYQAAFGSLLGVPYLRFTPNASVVLNTKHIELAMVLDVTGSMGTNGRIDGLKQAAKQLIDVLIANNPGAGAVKVSIVPYSAAVNVGAAYYTAATGFPAGADTCVVERQTMPGAIVDDAPGPGRYAAVSSPADNPQYVCPVAQILPLQDISVPSQKTAVDTLIDSLMPDGWTAGHIGAGWGWYTISSKWRGVWPAASRPRNEGPDVLKAVLVMTDGIFNTAYWTPNGGSNGEDSTVNHSSGDQALGICQNMRDAGVTVFTVAFEAPPAAEALLEQCAGSPANAFTAANADELTAKFRAVGDRLSMMRLSK